MLSRRTLALLTLLALGTLCGSILPARAAARPGAAEPARFIVELTAPALPDTPGPAAAGQLETAQSEALSAISSLVGAPAAPAYVYRHALNGFALTLTPAEAAAVAALPGVARVQRERNSFVQTDRGPSFIGAAQLDQRPALFSASLSGAQAVPPVAAAATGRAVARYDEAANALTFQLFYSGLSGPPTAAALHQGAPGATGPLALDLFPGAVGTPERAGGFAGTMTLSATAEADLFAGGLYLSLSTGANPAGELRGQLVASRGEGVVIGVLDTGVDPAHPSFQDPAPGDSYDHTNPRGPGSYLGVCSSSDGDGRYDPSFPCNDKLIGAYTFADTSGIPDPQGQASPRDNYGHGSHVAGIAAGNLVPGPDTGTTSYSQIAGVAPHANLIVYDVCGIPGDDRACPGAAILAAIDQAIADGVDLINLSLGDDSHDPWLDPQALALLRAAEGGVTAVAAAGNQGNDGPGTINAPANAPWVTGAGAVTHDRRPAGGPGDTLYARSSLGPDGFVPGLIKPDLAAPGVEILAAWANHSRDADDFAIITGTSMATPSAAGLAALLRQVHPDWTPSEIRSAMMLTAATGVRKANGLTAAGPFERGAGRISASAALAGFVLDESIAAYTAANPSSGGQPAALNLPALTDETCVGSCTFTRTLRSTLGVPVTWDIIASGDGFTLTTAPAGKLTLQPGARATIIVTATVTRIAPESYGYGSLTLSASGGVAPSATMPVAIPLSSSNLPEAIAITARQRAGSKSVSMRAVAISDLTVDAYGLVKLQPESLRLGPDPTPDNLADLSLGGLYQQLLTLPAGNLRFRAQIDQATAADLDMFVYVDKAGPGYGTYGPEDETLCKSVGPGAAELCDYSSANLLAGRAQAITITVLIQNLNGSGAAEDSFRLLWGRLNANQAENPGNLAVSGPNIVPAGQPFDLKLGWSLPEAQVGDVYIGAVNLGSSPAMGLAAPADLGATLLTITYMPYQTRLPVLVR